MPGCFQTEVEKRRSAINFVAEYNDPGLPVILLAVKSARGELRNRCLATLGAGVCFHPLKPELHAPELDGRKLIQHQKRTTD